jgi:regulator of sirC expression with transglutaminase-like and TPR domain
MPRKKEIESLVYLLDDPDPTVQQSIKHRLTELGDRAVPLLDEQRNLVDNEHEVRINDIIKELTAGHIEEDFLDIIEGGMRTLKELEKAVLLFSRFENPTLRVKTYHHKLDSMAEAVKDKIRFEADDVQQMHILLHYVFDELAFSGGTEDFYLHDNAYLDRVIDRRRGLPISLAFIILFLGRRLNLPFYGVNIPIHFLLKFKSSKEEIFIDPFDQGKTVTHSQCYYFLEQNGIEPESEHFSDADEAAMLARFIRNLIRSYQHSDNNSKAYELEQLLQILEQMYL